MKLEPLSIIFALLTKVIIVCSCSNIHIEIRPEDVNPFPDPILEIPDLPDYWEDYFKDKANILQNAATNIDGKGVSFVFITDVHVGSNNMNSPQLIKYLYANNYVKKVVCGGDLIYRVHNKKEDALSELYLWANSISPIPVVTILGNHDLNSNDQKYDTQVISEKLFYEIICKSNRSVRYKGDFLYGYEDNAKQKVRFIYLNTQAPDYYVMDNEQVVWLQERVLDLPKEWTIVVFCHQFWTGISSDIKTLEKDANGIKIEKALDEIYDKAKATIACVISGHCHRNYAKISDKGYPIVSTTCDTGGYNSFVYDPDTPYREAGTTTEQAFDIFYINTISRSINIIRIGAGDGDMDRSFYY